MLLQKGHHITLVSNILNALGEPPKFYYEGFVPDYPSPLPGGVEPRLTLSIEKFSTSLIKDVFMKFESPPNIVEDTKSYGTDKAQKFGQIVEGIPCQPGQFSCYWFMHRRGVRISARQRLHGQSSVPLPAYPGISIAEFYKSVKEQLTALSKEHKDMFTGNYGIQFTLTSLLYSVRVVWSYWLLNFVMLRFEELSTISLLLEPVTTCSIVPSWHLILERNHAFHEAGHICPPKEQEDKRIPRVTQSRPWQ